MSIENSIDRLAAAIEKLASAVLAPVVVGGVSGGIEPRPATEQEKAEIAAADAAAAKKPRGRPRKQGNIEIISQEGVTVETKSLTPDRVLSSDGKTEIVLVSEGVGADGIPETNYELRPTSAAAGPAVETATASETSTKESAAPAKEQASASTATAAAGSTESQTSAPATVESNLSKGDIVQILTGLQKKLEESATTVEEKRGAAQKCRDLIKSVVGSESLKDAKPEHFGRIKSAVLKVLNNE